MGESGDGLRDDDDGDERPGGDGLQAGEEGPHGEAGEEPIERGRREREESEAGRGPAGRRDPPTEDERGGDEGESGAKPPEGGGGDPVQRGRGADEQNAAKEEVPDPAGEAAEEHDLADIWHAHMVRGGETHANTATTEHGAAGIHGESAGDERDRKIAPGADGLMDPALAEQAQDGIAKVAEDSEAERERQAMRTDAGERGVQVGEAEMRPLFVQTGDGPRADGDPENSAEAGEPAAPGAGRSLLREVWLVGA
jgi:hypothetical protein